MKNKKVTITIEVDMNSHESRMWRYPKEYFNEAVKETLRAICDDDIRNIRGKYKAGDSTADYKIFVQSTEAEQSA